MGRRQPAQLLLIVAFIVTIGGVILSSPASGAPVISGQRANRAVKDLVGPGLIRAEIVTFNAGEVGVYSVDRGVVRKIRGRLLTLAERDGTVVGVRLSSATRIRIDGWRGTSRRVRLGMRATVMRSGNAAASWLYAVRRSSDKSGPKIESLLSDGFVRAEVISWAGGAVLDSRAYTGVIGSADDTSLTLQENDGASVQMQFDGAPEVWVNNRASSTADLKSGMRVTTIGNGDGVVSQIWAYGKKPGVGKK